jgi:pimeloyl-ACP methyl ester carboxylesterase
MKIVDAGDGSPVVLVPGIQGRWEWMQPTVEALARECRVITFSLADEPTCGAAFEEADGFGSYVRQIADAMDGAALDRAAICGVSFGGLIAAAFAARHPERVSALILVSALPPSWEPNSRVRLYVKAPRLLAPLFYLMSLRLYLEIAAAHEGWLAGVRAAVRHGWNVLRHPLSPVRMARRVRLLSSVDLRSEVARPAVRTLVITGEDRLERVVPPARTREYLTICPDSSGITLARTGHLGLMTRADEFARVVCAFVREAADDRETRRRLG